jgi:hypothetical protein
VVLLDISVFWKDCVLGVLLLGITSLDYLKSRLDSHGASATPSGSWRDDK